MAATQTAAYTSLVIVEPILSIPIRSPRPDVIVDETGMVRVTASGVHALPQQHMTAPELLDVALVGQRKDPTALSVVPSCLHQWIRIDLRGAHRWIQALVGVAVAIHPVGTRRAH